nr:glycoside hydrolase family 16 protein [Massilia sp. JS1662]
MPFSRLLEAPPTRKRCTRRSPSRPGGRWTGTTNSTAPRWTAPNGSRRRAATAGATRSWSFIRTGRTTCGSTGATSSSKPARKTTAAVTTPPRIKTAGKVERTYGRYEARIRIPRGQGIWPAFWLLGADVGTAGWPRCGEIDIMENIGREPDLVHGTLHGPGYSGDKAIGKSQRLDKGTYADGYHVYAVEWEPREIRWYRDGILYHTARPDTVTGDWVFEHPFFVILNLAVGGAWPGNPDATTAFPQQMLVDYVRVYKRAP